MSPGRSPQLKLTLLRALFVAALPTACAVGVQPDTTDQALGETGGDAGTAAGGIASMPVAGMSGSGSVPKAGTSSGGGGVTNAFGGTSNSGGKAGSSSGGSAGSGGSSSSGGSGGSSAGGKGGSGGSAGGSGGSAGGSGGSGGGSGGGTGSCSCKQTKAWTDNTSISWASGDCLTTGGKTYLYAGTKMQTYANGPCNPTMQAPWCTDSSNDYKFMLCN